MPIVMQCTALGCETLTMGPMCIEHEQQLEREFVRGRPFVRPLLEPRRAVTAPNAYAPSLRRVSERSAVAQRPR
jgi:hypothetical protein